MNPKGKGRFISGKLLMTENKGSIFVKYTKVAVVHMIYTTDMSYYSTPYAILCNKNPLTMFSTHCINLPSDSAGL